MGGGGAAISLEESIEHILSEATRASSTSAAPEELEVEVERILLKKVRRRKLTKREELILAYGHYTAGCSTCYAMVKVQR